ncbi:MAG: GNAT family N-acetyltransferase [Thermoleophilia bacterium]
MTAAIAFTAVDPARDTPLVHAWMQEPHVIPWWGLDGPESGVREYLDAQCALPHLVPWIADAAGDPFAYVETYRAAEDPLAAHYAATPGDRGWHILVGPASYLGSGVPRRLGYAVVRRLFDDPGANRVVCEPDIRNARMIAFCERLGGRVVAELDLPDKRAALVMWTDRP